MASRAAPTSHRATLAVLMALAMALRLLSPVGFMPAFDHGAVTIVPCPDAAPAGIAMMHHHHGDKAHPQPCPYAAGSAAGPLPWIASAALPSAPMAAEQPAATLAENAPAAQDRERPPATGPPLLPA
jgi:hypothetical protein